MTGELDLGRVAGYGGRTLAAEAEEQAAVLVPVLDRTPGSADDPSPRVLFTERADHLDSHAGEMSFPGGGREPEDADLRATALREAHEEIGLAPHEADVVGRLDDVPGPFGHVVRPYVARVPDRTYEPSEDEVAAIAVLSVADLTDPANYDSEERSHPERGSFTVEFFDVDGWTVWGLTGHILSAFLRLATDWEPPGPPDG